MTRRICTPYGVALAVLGFIVLILWYDIALPEPMNPIMNFSGSAQHRQARRNLGGYFSRNCPPSGFASRPNFDIESYVSELWYPIRAAPVVYAPDQSFCSVVKYTIQEGTCGFLCRLLGGADKPRIAVSNRGLDGSITGSLNEANIQAFVPKPDTSPAEIRVASLQRIFSFTRTNYWVIAADTYENVVNGTLGTEGEQIYDWALISGGPAFRETENGKCMAGYGSFDTRGFWFFSRDPTPPDGVVDAVTAYADSLGMDTSEWIPVIHEGCTYDFLNDGEGQRMMRKEEVY